MKRILIAILVVLVVIVVAAVVLVSLNMNSIIKKGIETGGPQIAKVRIALEAVSVSLLSGKGEIRHLVVGNPEGYKTESAIKLGQASVQIKPGSVFSDKVVVKSINIQAPEITLEGGLKENNLTKILANVEAATGSSEPKSPTDRPDKSSGKKIQVDELIIRDAKVRLNLNLPGIKTTSVPMPNIELRDLGTGADGITTTELTRKILQTVLKDVTQVVTAAVSDLGQGAVDAAKAAGEKTVGDAVQKAGQSATEAAEKAGKGLKNLLKK